MIEVSDFVYDLSDSHGGLKCLRMGFIFCGKHLLLMTRIWVSDQDLMGPLVLSFDGHTKKTSGSLLDLKGAVYTRIGSGKSVVLPTWILLFDGFGWNITIHGDKGSDINRKASRSVIELSIEPIFNLSFCENPIKEPIFWFKGT